MSGIEDVLDQDPRENYRNEGRERMPGCECPDPHYAESPTETPGLRQKIVAFLEARDALMGGRLSTDDSWVDQLGRDLDEAERALRAALGESVSPEPPKDPARAFAYWFSAQPWSIQRAFVHGWIDRHEPGDGPPFDESPQPAESPTETPGLRAIVERYDIAMRAIRRRHSQYAEGFPDDLASGHVRQHPETQCFADFDRAELLAIIDAALRESPVPAIPSPEEPVP
jgi:hypothetical protein